jgi:hypothetical protein
MGSGKALLFSHALTPPCFLHQGKTYRKERELSKYASDLADRLCIFDGAVFRLSNGKTGDTVSTWQM